MIPPKEKDISGDFAEWWERYPHKVDKANAQRAYGKARKKVDAQTLLTGLEAYRASKEPWRAWKGPAAWLNAERWNDQPAHSTQQAQAYRRGGTLDDAAASFAQRIEEAENAANG